METLTYSSGRASGCDSPGLLNLKILHGLLEAAEKGGGNRGRQARTPVLQHRIKDLRAEWDRPPGLSGFFQQPL